MQIKYELLPEDITNYSKEGAKGTSIYTVQVIIFTVITMLFIMSDMLMAVLGAFVNDGSIRIDAVNIIPRTIVGLALLGISYVVLMAVSRHAVRKLAATPGKNGLFCEHTIELGEAGFTETTHVNTGFQSWDGIEKVTETKSFVLLQIRLGAAYLVPKRAFASAQEINQFISVAQTICEEPNPQTFRRRRPHSVEIGIRGPRRGALCRRSPLINKQAIGLKVS